MKIAIGITTTPKRHHIFWENLKKWQEFLPNEAAIYYSISNKKIPVSANKNNVLAMCYDAVAQHIFIVDEDCYPIDKDWHLLYINSGLNHACWNFNRLRLGTRLFNDTKNNPHMCWDYETPNGCMLYFKREVINTIGGWDTDFKGYGYEHVNLSDRIFNVGLSPARYVDIPNSSHLFALSDCESSFTMEDRAYIPANYKLYKQKYYSKEFKPFK